MFDVPDDYKRAHRKFTPSPPRSTPKGVVVEDDDENESGKFFRDVELESTPLRRQYSYSAPTSPRPRVEPKHSSPASPLPRAEPENTSSTSSPNQSDDVSMEKEKKRSPKKKQMKQQQQRSQDVYSSSPRQPSQHQLPPQYSQQSPPTRSPKQSPISEQSIAESSSSSEPSKNVIEDGCSIKIEFRLPGFAKSEVSLNLDHDRNITVSAKSRYNEYQDTVRLPPSVDQQSIRAKFEDQCLVVSANKLSKNRVPIQFS
jgi:HSP20 family molecular chaperone IbpA